MLNLAKMFRVSRGAGISKIFQKTTIYYPVGTMDLTSLRLRRRRSV